jgi:hypothetical protein
MTPRGPQPDRETPGGRLRGLLSNLTGRKSGAGAQAQGAPGVEGAMAAVTGSGHIGAQSEPLSGRGRLRRLGLSVPHGPTVMILTALVSLVSLVAIAVAAVLGAIGVVSALLLALAVWIALPTLAAVALIVLALITRR